MKYFKDFFCILTLCAVDYLCRLLLPSEAHCSPRSEGLSAFLHCLHTRLINELQNSIILILKIGKILNVRYVGNLILNIHGNCFDGDVIIVMSSVHGLSVYYFLHHIITQK